MNSPQTYENTFQSTDGKDRLDIKLDLLGGGTMAHLTCNLTAYDDDQGVVTQKIAVDIVLDSKFHIQIHGLDGEQADQFADYVLTYTDAKKVERKIVHSLDANGKLQAIRTTDIADQPFSAVFAALSHSLGAIKPAIPWLQSIDNPIWQAAYWIKAPFFGSDSHRTKKIGMMQGTEFDFEKLIIWISAQQNNPEYRIRFRSDEDCRKFVRDYPANKDGGTMMPHSEQTYIYFAIDPKQINQRPISLQKTIEILKNDGYITEDEAIKFVAHMTILGAGNKKLPLEKILPNPTRSR